MFKMATLPEQRNTMDLPVNCDNCSTPMTTDGVNYSCLKNAELGPHVCPTLPVNAEMLAVQVTTQLLKRLMNDVIVAVLTEDVLRAASEMSRTQRERLHNSESAIMELNHLKEEALRPVEQDLTTYQEAAAEIHRIYATTMGLTYESHIAQEELDKLAFISDPEGLREDARGMAAHLDDADPSQTEQLLNIFVSEVRVGLELAEIFYTHPLPDDENRPEVESDRVALAT